MPMRTGDLAGARPRTLPPPPDGCGEAGPVKTGAAAARGSTSRPRTQRREVVDPAPPRPRWPRGRGAESATRRGARDGPAGAAFEAAQRGANRPEHGRKRVRQERRPEIRSRCVRTAAFWETPPAKTMAAAASPQKTCRRCSARARGRCRRRSRPASDRPAARARGRCARRPRTAWRCAAAAGPGTRGAPARRRRRESQPPCLLIEEAPRAGGAGGAGARAAVRAVAVQPDEAETFPPDVEDRARVGEKSPATRTRPRDLSAVRRCALHPRSDPDARGPQRRGHPSCPRMPGTLRGKRHRSTHSEDERSACRDPSRGSLAARREPTTPA